MPKAKQLFSKAIDNMFNCLGQGATYLNNQGKTKNIQAILKKPDKLVNITDATLHLSSTTIEVRTKELKNPLAKEKILIQETTYIIQGEPERDQHHLIWKLEVYSL